MINIVYRLDYHKWARDLNNTQFLTDVWVYCPVLNRPKRQPETNGREKKIGLATFVIKIKIIFYPNDALNKNIQVIRAPEHELSYPTRRWTILLWVYKIFQAVMNQTHINIKRYSTFTTIYTIHNNTLFCFVVHTCNTVVQHTVQSIFCIENWQLEIKITCGMGQNGRLKWL